MGKQLVNKCQLLTYLKSYEHVGLLSVLNQH